MVTIVLYMHMYHPMGSPEQLWLPEAHKYEHAVLCTSWMGLATSVSYMLCVGR
jgi:hypothetical protein